MLSECARFVAAGLVVLGVGGALRFVHSRIERVNLRFGSILRAALVVTTLVAVGQEACIGWTTVKPDARVGRPARCGNHTLQIRSAQYFFEAVRGFEQLCPRMYLDATYFATRMIRLYTNRDRLGVAYLQVRDSDVQQWITAELGNGESTRETDKVEGRLERLDWEYSSCVGLARDLILDGDIALGSMYAAVQIPRGASDSWSTMLDPEGQINAYERLTTSIDLASAMQAPLEQPDELCMGPELRQMKADWEEILYDMRRQKPQTADRTWRLHEFNETLSQRWACDDEQ